MGDGCNVPVVILFFNQPDHLEQVFEKVKLVRPKQIFLIQDGPRNNNMLDNVRILRCRRIMDQINWDCEIYKRYSRFHTGYEENHRLGLSWVFDRVESAIILEEDCIPAFSFFTYCEELLEKYKEDARISLICGFNPFHAGDTADTSYFFAKAGITIGWATWKRVWKQYYKIYELSQKDKSAIALYGENFSGFVKDTIFNNLQAPIDKEKNMEWDCWMTADRYLNHRLAIIPRNSLAVPLASEYAKREFHSDKYIHQEVHEIDQVIHPNFVFQNMKYDKQYENLFYKRSQIHDRSIFRLIKRYRTST
jgi:hypothetical protein